MLVIWPEINKPIGKTMCELIIVWESTYRSRLKIPWFWKQELTFMYRNIALKMTANSTSAQRATDDNQNEQIKQFFTLRTSINEWNMASVHLEVFVRHSSYWHKKRGRSANHREMWSRLAHNSAPNRWPVCLNPVSSCVDFMGQLFHSRQFYTLHELLLWKLLLSARRYRRGF